MNLFPQEAIAQDYNSEIECLAKTMYHEARGNSLEAQIAVAWVTLNRTKADKFPDTVCHVIKQKGQYPWYIKKDKIHETKKYNELKLLAFYVYEKHQNNDIPIELKPIKNALFFDSNKKIKSNAVKIDKFNFREEYKK